MGIRVAIDASRGRSGGAKSYLIGFIQDADPKAIGVDEIHVWSYKELLKELPERSWLRKHSHSYLEKSLLYQLIWQLFKLKKAIRKSGCHVLLSTDAGTIYVHHPSIVMSRDMLSFERSEIARYSRFIPWLRLFILRFIQLYSLKRADGVLFLTRYAADTIQRWSSSIFKYRIIPHGVGNNFKNNKRRSSWPSSGERNIRCMYISNTAMYKHQWHVVEAFYMLKKDGFSVEIEFVGGGHGDSNQLLNDYIKKYDPNDEFTRRLEFLPHNELPASLASCDIFVFASSCENMPNTLIEAMACGLPIACSNLGPMPEVLRDGGVYFHPEQPNSIYNAVKSLIEDSEGRELLASRAKNYSEEYSWKRCSNETLIYLVDIYKESITKEK